MKLRALKGRVIVEMEQKKMSDGGLHIPQNLIERSGLSRATVVSVGSDITDMKKGDTVAVKSELGFRCEDGKTRIYLLEDVAYIVE